MEELNHATRLEYPRALMYQNPELAQAHLQKIEQLKERRSALQHYKRALDEKLQKTAGMLFFLLSRTTALLEYRGEERGKKNSLSSLYRESGSLFLYHRKR